MADTPKAPTETPEEIAKREAQQREMVESGASQDQGILGMIMGFLKFLFSMFMPSTNAPNEGPSGASETAADKLRLGKRLIDEKVIPKWKAYQEAHQGEAVVFQSPVLGKSQVTSGFGHRDTGIKGASTEHAGVDIGARDGDRTPNIVASADGIVLFSGQKSGYGNTVILGHKDGSYTLYAHMSGEKMPGLGAQVKQGVQIGVMSTSGVSDGGVHLHYEQHRGEATLSPKIAGVTLAKGMMVASAPVNQDTQFAALTDRAALPKLAVADGKPVAPVFAAVAQNTVGNVRVH